MITVAMMSGKTNTPLKSLLSCLEVHVVHRHQRELDRREEQQERDEERLERVAPNEPACSP